MSPAHILTNAFNCVKYLSLIISRKGGGMLIAVLCHTSDYFNFDNRSSLRKNHEIVRRV